MSFSCHKCSLLRSNVLHRRDDENAERARLLAAPVPPVTLMRASPLVVEERRRRDWLLSDLANRAVSSVPARAAALPGEESELERGRRSPNPSSSSSSLYHPPRLPQPPRALVGVAVLLLLPAVWKECVLRARRREAAEVGEEELRGDAEYELLVDDEDEFCRRKDMYPVCGCWVWAWAGEWGVVERSGKGGTKFKSVTVGEVNPNLLSGYRHGALTTLPTPGIGPSHYLKNKNQSTFHRTVVLV